MSLRFGCRSLALGLALASLAVPAAARADDPPKPEDFLRLTIAQEQ